MSNTYKKLLIFLSFIICIGLPITIMAQSESDWWTAIRTNNTSAIQNMLKMGANTSALNDIGNPALIQAAREQSWDVFDLLANTAKVNVDQANTFDETALMYLAILGQTDRAKNLIKKGASVNRLGWTPLHYAASKAQIETSKLLIDKKAIVNAPGTDGTTPLMMAAATGKAAIVNLLLQHGADPTMFNEKGETAADFARNNKSPRLAALLDESAKKVSNERAGIIESPADLARDIDNAKSAAETEDNMTSKYFDLERFE